MSRYMPVYQYPEMMPVDISFVFEDEKPAGKHGFCRVDGENFRFEDGTLAKFWGVIFNGASCFPSHDYAEGVAQRLSQAGCNFVRFHQIDADWATPNLFRFTAGKPTRNTRSFDPRSMERMDYLIKCLKEQGIYIAVDMMTYRKFKPGDGVPFAEDMWDNHKQYTIYDPWLIELQKEHCTNFWNHVNPYTGLAYKDDPVFAFCDITNENDMFIRFGFTKLRSQHIPYYDDEFRTMLDAWVKQQGIDYDAFTCDLNSRDAVQVRFRMHKNREFARTMYDHIRSLGVKIPLCCTNWESIAAQVMSQDEMDFQDGHCYYYDWSWGEYEKISQNKSLMDSSDFPMGNKISNRIHGQPYVMTEWDMPWPNSYRCEAPLWFPAMGCLHNFSAMSIHTYGYHTRRDSHSLLGKEASSNTLGITAFREGLFTCWNDPAKFGLFYHGALMMRRGDLQSANHVIGAKFTDITKQEDRLVNTAGDMHQVHVVLDSTDISDLTDIRMMNDAFVRENPTRLVSDTGQVTRDLQRRIGIVDAPRTKAVFGVIGNRSPNGAPPKRLELNGMVVESNTDLATIALSSLTNDPIEKSDSMLLSAIGRASNRGQRMDGEKLLDIGTGPIEAEIIDAVISIKTDNEKLRVQSINSEGFYVGYPTVTHENGWMTFHIGPQYPGLYYLISEY